MTSIREKDILNELIQSLQDENLSLKTVISSKTDDYNKLQRDHMYQQLVNEEKLNELNQERENLKNDINDLNSIVTENKTILAQKSSEVS